MKLELHPLGLATALTDSIIYIICVLFFALAPGFTLTVLSYVTHVDLKIFTKVFGWGNFFVGLIIVFAASYAIGWIFAWIYNKFLKQE